MKLSEAIRLGAMLRPQLRVGYFSPRRNVEKTCALGAALSAVVDGILGNTDIVVWTSELSSRWPFLQEQHAHPVSGCRHRLSYLIVQLNDTYHWTRERIADWVETIEPQEEPVQELCVAAPRPAQQGTR